MATSRKVLTIVITLVALAGIAMAAVSYRDVINEEWDEFKTKYNKSYADQDEDNFRFKIFLENKHKIAQHNRRAATGLHKFTMKLNKYSDMTHEDFKATMNGFLGRKRSRQDIRNLNPLVASEHWKLNKGSDDTSKLPVSLDWRQHGYVTPVKDQGHCGSCWAFSSTGALEGQHFRTTGDLISLSEQNLIDCSKRFGNHGCEGGLMEYAFEYIKNNHGVDTENSYPYEAKDSKCRFVNKTIGADEKGYVEIPAGNEKKLLLALFNKGPISVAIDASQESFRHYDGGIYDEPNCSDEDLDHAVLVVGYGTDPIHGDYWLVKNSWSESWGQAGYIKMSRNKENQCGIASSAVYPVV